MYKPEECQNCRETELEFHESLEIYNPESDEEENIKNVYRCLNCNTTHFEVDGQVCIQMEITITKTDSYVV